MKSVHVSVAGLMGIVLFAALGFAALSIPRDSGQTTGSQFTFRFSQLRWLVLCIVGPSGEDSSSLAVSTSS
jgi:hypothetical protein